MDRASREGENSGRVVAGLRAAKFFESSSGDKLKAIPGTPGLPRSYE